MPLSGEQTHYLKTVLRRPDGAKLRVFNGEDGEWQASLHYTGKKGAFLKLQQLLRHAAPAQRRLHLVFAPIRKERMEFMVEKAVELGATDLHPVLTQYTVVRDINEERLRRQIMEAAEQCERLDLPRLHGLTDLKHFLASWTGKPLLAAIERVEASPVATYASLAECALLIGPEGGFSEEEKENLACQASVHPVSLGNTILRAETAAIFGLSVLTAGFTK